MNFATFILSTGRCGTQWLAKNLFEAYGNRLAVSHEPLYTDYYPRKLLGLNDPALCENAPIIFRHINNVEKALNSVPYVECGWESYGALRYLAERFRGRVRIVHLTRHPVPTAASMVTHNYYTGRRVDPIEEKALLTPFDEGIVFKDYRKRWNSMSTFSKCLYFWLEVHTLGMNLEQDLDLPWLRLKSEDLFGGDALPRLLEFLELPPSSNISEARGRHFDRFPLKINENINPMEVKQHPEIIELAKQLGYDALEVNVDKIKERYEQ